MQALPLIDDQRVQRLFPSLSKMTYLASCSHGLQSVKAAEALQQYLKDWRDIGTPWIEWEKKLSTASGFFGDLIGVQPNEIAPTYSVTTALNTLLSCFDFSKGKNIVTSNLEFPTVSHALLARKSLGVEIRMVNSSNYQSSVDQYEKLIDENTILVTAVHTCSVNGFKQDLGAIADIAHRNGAYVFSDLYQSVGAMPLDMHKFNIDFAAAGTYKYLLGTGGFAFLYVRNDLINKLDPKVIGWHSQADRFGFGPTQLSYASNAGRFMLGTPSHPSVYSGVAGMQIIKDQGIDNIWNRISDLSKYGTEQALVKGFQLLSPLSKEKRGPMISLLLDDPHESELRIRGKDILTSARSEGLRLSFHFYNSRFDVDAALEALGRNEVDH